MLDQPAVTAGVGREPGTPTPEVDELVAPLGHRGRAPVEVGEPAVADVASRTVGHWTSGLWDRRERETEVLAGVGLARRGAPRSQAATGSSSDGGDGAPRPTLMMASKKSAGRPHSELTKMLVTLSAMATIAHTG